MQEALAGDERTQVPHGDAPFAANRRRREPARHWIQGRQNPAPGLLTCRCGGRARLIVGPRAMPAG
jgi:hypothetical protein